MRFTRPSERNLRIACIYSTVEIAQITGFSIKQLDYWAKQGILVPSVQLKELDYADASGVPFLQSFYWL